MPHVPLIHYAGPSGCGFAIVATVAEGGEAYKLAVPWSEAGCHTVAITLDGVHVGGSPFTVDAITQVGQLLRSQTAVHPGQKEKKIRLHFLVVDCQ